MHDYVSLTPCRAQMIMAAGAKMRAAPEVQPGQRHSPSRGRERCRYRGRMPHRRRRDALPSATRPGHFHPPREVSATRGAEPPPRIALISTSMSNLSQKDPPELSEATTGRSKCQRCREPILKGEQRVGMLTRTSRSLRTCGLRHQPPAYRTYLWRWAAAGAPRTYAVRVPASLGVPHIPRTVAPQAGGHGRPIVGHLRAQMGC